MKTISNFIIACFIIVFCGCVKKDKDNPAPVDNSVSSMPLQFSGTVNSQKVSFQGSSITDFETSDKSYAAPYVNQATYSCSLQDTSEIGIMVIIKGLQYSTFEGAKKPDSISFKNFITARNYKNAEVGISYNDKDHKGWFTQSDPIDFKIIEVKEERHHGNYGIKFRAEFSCTIYTFKDPLNPNIGFISQKIQNGVLVGYFENK